jgi:hypothetical protein
MKVIEITPATLPKFVLTCGSEDEKIAVAIASIRRCRKLAQKNNGLISHKMWTIHTKID